MLEQQTRHTILCVDDEPAALRLRGSILQAEGFAVLTATNAEEGLALFRGHAVDLVISDHLLGRQTGTQMAFQMKRFKPTVPILILSGTTEVPADIQHADAFLSKLEGPREMLSKVYEMLSATTAQSRIHGSGPTAAAAAPAPQPATHTSDLEKQHEELRTSHARLEGIVNSTMDAIITVDEQHRIVLFNAAAERKFGYAFQEMQGQTIDRLIPDLGDSARRFETQKSAAKGGSQQLHLLTGLRKNGNAFPIEATISQATAAGQRLHTVVLRDITERKRAEEELLKSERLAQAGRMAATVAHEINNPLETVVNALYLVERAQTMDETSRQLVQTAQEELARVVQITKLTLGFSRQEERVPSETSPIDQIENILALYGRKLRLLEVNIEKQYRTQRKIKAVAGEIRQIFANLIVNAADALASVGDRLVIRVSDSVDWRDTTRKGVRVSICDNGPGIGKKEKAHLFEPFYSTKGQKGTGLGLWVSLGIVNKHGGSIRLRSLETPGRSGTVFSIFLPDDCCPAQQ